MAIDVIRGKGKSHMVRPGTEMVMKEGRDPDGKPMTLYSAMGICGTEVASGAIAKSEIAKDVSCERCAKRAEAVLTDQQWGVSELAAPAVLQSPETVREPRKRDYRSEGARRHARITHDRQMRRVAMKRQLEAMR